MKQVCVLGAYDFDYQATKGSCNDDWVAEAMFKQFLGRQGLNHMVQVEEDLLITKEPISQELVDELFGITYHKEMISTLEARGYTITNYEPFKELLIEGKYELVRGIQVVDLDNLSKEDLEANSIG